MTTPTPDPQGMPPFGEYAAASDVLSLPDLLEALSDSCGLLDQIVENLAHHRSAQENSGRMVDLHSIEDFTSQGWAFARTAHTRLTEYLAVKP